MHINISSTSSRCGYYLLRNTKMLWINSYLIVLDYPVIRCVGGDFKLAITMVSASLSPPRRSGTATYNAKTMESPNGDWKEAGINYFGAGRTFKQISLGGKQRYWSRTIDIVHNKNDVNIILISFEINEIRNYNNLNGFCSFLLQTHIRIWHINRFDMKIWSGALIKTQWMRWIKFKMENEFK